MSYQISRCSRFTAISAERDKRLLQAFFSHPKIRLTEILKAMSLPAEQQQRWRELSLKQTAEASEGQDRE